MTFQNELCLAPIGYVKTKAVGDEVKNKSLVSQLVISENLAEALEGVEDFSHLFVLFWLNQTSEEKRTVLKVHPRGRMDMPLVGVFAARTMCRPNPIGLTLVELLKVDGNILTVRGLDAFDGTPVLDIKPFDSWDAPENARVPDWWIKLNELKK